MRSSLRWLALLLVVAGCLKVWADGKTANGEQSRPAVVLVSIDGLKPEYVLQADHYGLKIPNLRQFLQNGTYADGVRGVFPTVTYPSHTTLITGVAPAKHGIEANTTFDPLMKNMGGWYWYAEDIKVPTLWGAATEAGLKTANVHWPVSVGAHIDYNLPQIWRTGTADDRKLVRALSTPGLLESLERELGPYADGIKEDIAGDENRGAFAARLMEKVHPQFITIYLTALDTEQHASGPFSPEALAVLERIDAIVGKLRETAAKVSGTDTVFCIVSDHGFVRSEHDFNILIPFLDAGLITLDASGNTKEWSAVPWVSGGTAAVVLKDPHDSATLAKVRSMLKKLTSDPNDGISEVIDADAIHRLEGFTTAQYAILLRPEYKFAAGKSGPLITPTHGGMHGYSPDLPAMYSSFFITGPDIPAAEGLGIIDMRAIAPTLAEFLHIRLPQAEVPALEFAHSAASK